MSIIIRPLSGSGQAMGMTGDVQLSCLLSIIEIGFRPGYILPMDNEFSSAISSGDEDEMTVSGDWSLALCQQQTHPNVTTHQLMT